MINKILESKEYKKLITRHTKESISYLMDLGVEFAITANLKGLTFTPELPNSIKSRLANFSLFVLSNYTYTTVILGENELTFEAGFGSENFASVVTVPYISIFQIVIGESIISINTLATVDDLQIDLNVHNKSFNAFKNNPFNKKLID